MTTLENVKGRLSADAYDWLVGCTDPFHDFEHPIEGAPDESIGRSYTRKFVQTTTIGTTADDDNISVVFTGCHGSDGANFYNGGVDATVDNMVAGVTMYPIMTLRSDASVGAPSLVKLIAGTSVLVSGMGTCQVGTVPSRLVSLGIELTDTTQPLYKRGTLCAAHMNSPAAEGTLKMFDGTVQQVPVFMPSPMSVTPTEITTHPGAYIGATAKGLYLQARLNKMQPPKQQKFRAYNNTVFGSPNVSPCMREPNGPTGSVMYIVPTVNQGDVVGFTTFAYRNAWNDSGFCPFVVNLSGLSINSTLQLTVKCTVEYFPSAESLFELGLATFSPCYEPDAFRFYHEIMRQIPAGVPVAMNAAGDYWRMITSAAKKLGGYGVALAPHILKAIEYGSTIAGRPELAAAAKATGFAVSMGREVVRTSQRKKKPSAALRLARIKRG